MPEQDAQPIVIFDGVCGMCNRFVSICLRNDARGELLFTPNGSQFGAALCENLRLLPESQHTIIVVIGDQVLLRSDAVVYIARHLKAPYSYLAYIQYVPRFIRDAGYRVIASIRRMIPFSHSACELLPAELQSRIRENL